MISGEKDDKSGKPVLCPEIYICFCAILIGA